MDVGVFGKGDSEVLRHDYGECWKHCQQDHSGLTGKTAQENGMKFRQRVCGAYSK